MRYVSRSAGTTGTARSVSIPNVDGPIPRRSRARDSHGKFGGCPSLLSWPVAAISGGSTKEDVPILLDAFIAAVKRYGYEETVVNDVQSLTESVKREAADQRPDRGRIERYLDRIKTLLLSASSVVVPVAELTAQIEKICSAVGHL
jgi:hypothetical protein